MTRKTKQLTFSVLGAALLLLLVAAGTFLFIRNTDLRTDFERVQIAGYVYKADELVALAKKRHPEAKVVRNTSVASNSRNGKSIDFALACDLVIGVKTQADSLATINRPSAVIADKTGVIHVAEYRDGLIKKFSEDGAFITAFGGKGQGPGEFSGLLQLAFDRDGVLLVYDFASKRLSRFTTDGDYLSEITIPTTHVPAGFAVDAFNHLYLSFYNHRQDRVIHKYSSTGELLASFGLPLAFKNKPSFNELDIQNKISGGSILLAEDAVWFSRRNPYEIMKFSHAGELLMSIFRDNDFIKPAEVKIVGRNRYGFPIPPMATLVCVFEDKVINWLWLPERQSPEIGTFVDIFNLDGLFLQTIALPERVWANSMDEAGRVYCTRNTPAGMQVVRYVLE